MTDHKSMAIVPGLGRTAEEDKQWGEAMEQARKYSLMKPPSAMKIMVITALGNILFFIATLLLVSFLPINNTIKIISLILAAILTIDIFHSFKLYAKRQG